MADKKTDAWMPLWIGAYMADTMHLTTVQHGAYLLLLMAYWRERAPLVDDDDALRAITKLERTEWKKHRPVLARFFKVDAGAWSHKRVEQEIAAADARASSATAKSKKAAAARWSNASGDAPSIPQALPEDVLKECPTPSPLPSEDSEAKASAGVPPAPEPPKAKSPEDVAKAELWKAAVSVLENGGCPKSQCRTFMGKLVGDYTLEAVQQAVAAAVTAQPADAREYLKATCQRLKGERKDPVTVPSDAAEKTARYLAEQAEHAAIVERERLDRLAKRATQSLTRGLPA